MRTFATRLRPRRRLLIFARVPQHGRVKSRLAGALGQDAALALYEAMLSDLLDRVAILRKRVSIEILWTAEGDVTGAALREHFRDFELARQSGQDLGERLQMAFSERVFFHEASSVIAIGVDEPSIDAHTILNAFELLESCEWVVGPATDGGYWLIGSRAGTFRTAAFRDIPWGTGAVFESTMRALRAMKRTIAILPLRRDIDELDDLRALAEADGLSPRIAAVAERLPALEGGST